MTRVVAVDVSAVPADPRGAGRYVVEVVRALAARGNVDLRLEARTGDADRWEAIAPGASIAAVVPASAPVRLAWEQVAGPRFVDGLGADVFHGPHYTMPEIARTPKVVTVHDLTFFDHPEWHRRSKVSFFRRAIRVAARRADAIVCVSDATARRFGELLSPKGAVHVVPHGIDHATFTPVAGADDDAVLRNIGVDGAPFVAFVGTLEPRKDLATLVRAFDDGRVAGDHPDVRLVVAGGRGWHNAEFEKALAASEHRDRIVLTGYVPDATVPVLFRNATAVVYTALEEGFGLPAVEALACGAPTVTTEGSVMEELTDGAAMVVPPRSPDSLAATLAEVLGAPGSAELERRRRLGLEVAARYTWDACAAGHEAVYEATAGRR